MMVVGFVSAWRLKREPNNIRMIDERLDELCGKWALDVFGYLRTNSDLEPSSYSVVSTKNSTTTERAYRIEKQRLLVGTYQVVPNPTGPDTGDAS